MQCKLHNFIIKTVLGLIIAGAFIYIAHYVYKSINRPFFNVRIPKPTGKFDVGTFEYHFIDTKRIERRSFDPNHPYRELMVKVWYPALYSQKTYADYITPQLAPFIEEDLRKLENVDLELLTHLSSIKSYAKNAAPIVVSSHYPLIIFSPGFGMPVILYSALLEELASHGYVVAGINHTYVTNPVIFPDGRIIAQHTFSKDSITKKEERYKEYQIWIADISFVIDELDKIHQDSNSPLKDRINFNRIGIMGHSFGGSVAVEACYRDTRCTTGIDIEGKLYSSHANKKIDKPFMFMVAPHEKEILKPIKDLVSKSHGQLRYVEIKEADHGSFSDLGFIAHWVKQPNFEPTKIINIARSYIVDFFDTHLKIGRD